MTLSVSYSVEGILAHFALQCCFNFLRFVGNLCAALLKSPPQHFNQYEVWTLTRLLQHLDYVLFSAILLQICYCVSDYCPVT